MRFYDNLAGNSRKRQVNGWKFTLTIEQCPEGMTKYMQAVGHCPEGTIDNRQAVVLSDLRPFRCCPETERQNQQTLFGVL